MKRDKKGQFVKEERITKGDFLHLLETKCVYEYNFFGLYDFSKGLNKIDLETKRSDIEKHIEKIDLFLKMVTLHDKKEIELTTKNKGYTWGCEVHLSYIHLHIFGDAIQSSLKLLKLNDKYSIDTWKKLNIKVQLISIKEALMDFTIAIDERLKWFDELI